MALGILSGPSGTVSGTSGDDFYVLTDPPANGVYTIPFTGGVDRLDIRDSSLSENFSFNCSPSASGGTLYVYKEGRTTVDIPAGLEGLSPNIDLLVVNFLAADGSTQDVELQLFHRGGASQTATLGATVGTTGNDVIKGDIDGGFISGRSYIFGGDGNDTLTGSKNHLFVLEGGLGDDTLKGANRTADILYGGKGKDDLFGLTGADALSGGADSDDIFGGKSDDLLLGGSGNDNLDGGAGNDLLMGGVGRDRLSGNLGADDFVFGTTNLGRDTIIQFELGIDKVILDGITSTNFSILAQAGGGSLVTVLSSGQEILFDNLSASVIQSRAADIFELG